MNGNEIVFGMKQHCYVKIQYCTNKWLWVYWSKSMEIKI